MVTVNVPPNPVSVAVKFCAAPAPVAMNESADGARLMVDEPGVGDGVGDGAGDDVGAGVGVAVATGTPTVEAVPPVPLHAATAVPSAKTAAKIQSRDVTSRPHQERGCGTAVRVCPR